MTKLNVGVVEFGLRNIPELAHDHVQPHQHVQLHHLEVLGRFRVCIFPLF